MYNEKAERVSLPNKHARIKIIAKIRERNTNKLKVKKLTVQEQLIMCLLSGQVFGAAAVLAAASCVALHAVVGQADLRIDYFTFTLAALRGSIWEELV